MPLYEYQCDEDGTVVTLLRSMQDADKPVEDPDGLGRSFNRVYSTFSVGEAGTAARSTGAIPSCPTCCTDGQCGI